MNETPGIPVKISLFLCLHCNPGSHFLGLYPGMDFLQISPSLAFSWRNLVSLKAYNLNKFIIIIEKFLFQ